MNQSHSRGCLCYSKSSCDIVLSFVNEVPQYVAKICENLPRACSAEPTDALRKTEE
jgi:hypothetical protein